MLKYEAKGKMQTNKIELFEASLWESWESYRYHKKFRLRVNGVWWPKGEHKYFYKTEIRDLLWGSIPFY